METQADGSPPLAISDVCTSLAGTPAAGTVLSFSLPHLPLGTYQATLLLRNAASMPPKRLPVSKKTKLFRVVSRADTLPMLVASPHPVEYVLELNQLEVDVYVPHVIYAKDASILQADDVKVCISRVYTPVSEEDTPAADNDSGSSTSSSSGEDIVPPDSADSAQYPPSTCLSVYSRALLPAGRLVEGRHHVELVLQDEQGHLISSSKVHPPALSVSLSIWLTVSLSVSLFCLSILSSSTHLDTHFSSCSCVWCACLSLRVCTLCTGDRDY